MIQKTKQNSYIGSGMAYWLLP